MPKHSLFKAQETFDLHPFGVNGHPAPVFRTEHGALFKGDCSEVLKAFSNECVDTVFADPPFNLGKDYGGTVNDRLDEGQYLPWCHRWIDQCIRDLFRG